MIRVIIAGSRYFNDYNTLKSMCDYYLSNLIKSDKDIVIVSGHARGTDSLGERYSSERNFRCKIFPANWNKYGKSAGYIRNQEMADFSDYLIAFKLKTAENKGTNHMINIAKEKGLKIRVVEL